MKRLTYFLAIALTAVLAFACTQKIEDALTVSSSEITVSSYGAQQTLSFSSNVAWTVSSSADWITFDKSSGEAGAASVVMKIAANTGYDQRTATVTITAGTKTTSIDVTQTETDEFAAIVTYDISSEAQEVVYELTSNISYTYTVDADAQSWISATASTKAAPTSGKLTFSIKSNTDVNPRTGKVYIKTEQYSYCMVINQGADFTILDESSVKYLGNSMNMIDENGKYKNYQEYYIKLSNGNETVNLAVNTEGMESPLSGLPTGTFEVDAAANHAPNTFSIKLTNGKEYMYTSIVKNDLEIAVEDGEIKIEKNDNGYVITAALIDQIGNENKYYFSGSLGEIADQHFAAQATSASFVGQYNTYYASGVNQWSITLLSNSTVTGSQQLFHYATFNLNGPTGNISGEELPTGTFTLAAPEDRTDLNWASGILDAQSNTMSSVYLYDVDTNWNYNYFYFDEGANVVVDKNDDGTYNFSFHGKAALYVYDDNYNLVKSGSSFDYEYSYTHVAVTVDTQSSLKPCPDGDVEFKTVMSSQYVGLWWGKAYKETYGTDANVFTFGFSNVNGIYTAYLTVVDDNNWTWTGNFGSTSLYCNTPFAEGTYNFSRTPAKMTLVPCAYSYVQNGYSGTKCPITGGYIMLDGSKCYYNLTVANPDDASVTYKVTGSHDASLYYLRNYSAKNKALIAITE